jgi:hypothetical protein
LGLERNQTVKTPHEDCPFRCGWSADAHDDEDGRVALCVHLEVEHGADPERDEEAWEYVAAIDPHPMPPFRFEQDEKLIQVLLRDAPAHPAWWFAKEAGVDEAYAEQALARMEGDPAYPVLRRRDLGPDVYEATEDSAREWRRD